MLIDELNCNVEEFKKVFKKKFDNFCKKAPILMSYIMKESSVDIFSHNDEKQSKKLFTYGFDYNSSVQKNIKLIKDRLLENHYPILVDENITYYDYSAEELNQMVSEGTISLDDIETTKREVKKTIKWRIERVIILRDEVFIRNMDTNKMYRYRMKIPVTVFLKKCRINFTPVEAWNYFITRSILINEVYEHYNSSENKNDIQ